METSHLTIGLFLVDSSNILTSRLTAHPYVVCVTVWITCLSDLSVCVLQSCCCMLCRVLGVPVCCTVFNRLCFMRDATVARIKGFVRAGEPLPSWFLEQVTTVRDRVPSTDLQVTWINMQ